MLWSWYISLKVTHKIYLIHKSLKYLELFSVYLKQKYIFALQVAAYQNLTAPAVLILLQYE